MVLILLAGSAGAYPPPAILKIDGNEQTSGIGSNCWREENQTVYICSDTIGIITPTEPLLTRSPFTAHLRLSLLELPTEAGFSTTPVTDDDEFKELANGVRVWRLGSGGNRYRLPSVREPDINLSLEPGLYVLNVGAEWKDRGSATYGFLVKVYNPAAEVTTQAATVIESEISTKSSPNETHNIIPTISSLEKAAGFEAVLAITILLALYIIGRKIR